MDCHNSCGCAAGLFVWVYIALSTVSGGRIGLGFQEVMPSGHCGRQIWENIYRLSFNGWLWPRAMEVNLKLLNRLKNLILIPLQKPQKYCKTAG
jgi:hypothetical protein